MDWKKKISPFDLAVTPVFTALVCVTTIVFSIYVPSTNGFFNIGESMVFLSALLFGPFVGAFSGGVGSMLADLLLGYPHYAPATLVIKACEGAITGAMRKRKPEIDSNFRWKIFTLLLGIIAGLLLGGIGRAYYSGNVEITLGKSSFMFYVSPQFWAVLGISITLLITALGFLTDPLFGWTVLSVITGGLVMVSGYFLYPFFIIGPLFNIQVVAVAEIPINIGQMIIGATVALPTTKLILRILPELRNK